MTIEEIMLYLRVDPTKNDTVLFKMLEQLVREARDEGFEAGYDAGARDTFEGGI